MAGIGVKLNKIYEKRTITTNLYGLGYSVVATIAPMFMVILSILVMQLLLDGFFLGYSTRLVFACTVLYIFVFALLAVSLVNSVFSKYLSDIIYREKYDDILPCFYMGLGITVPVSILAGIPFCLKAYQAGQLSLAYVFAGYCGYVLLVIVLYAMIYLSICKDYGKISLFYAIGAAVTVLVSLILVWILKWNVELGMLVALDVGFLVTAGLEIGLIRGYFRGNSGNYRGVFQYFRRYWKLVIANFVYVLGLYVHNFVFWSTDMRIVVADTFVCVLPYDMATCLGMFTNISSSVIFISRMERFFHERYKNYSEAVIGGRWRDIVNAKSRMFRQLSEELMTLMRIQFIVSVVLFLLAIIFLPRFGYAGLVMRIYPCMAAGYFIMFIMYAAMLYFYYFNDLNGALLTAVSFCVTTFLVSIWATRLPEMWYGLGITAGSLVGWIVSYFRLRHLERGLDEHIFCEGHLMKMAMGRKPESKVFDRYHGDKEQAQKEENKI